MLPSFFRPIESEEYYKEKWYCRSWNCWFDPWRGRSCQGRRAWSFLVENALPTEKIYAVSLKSSKKLALGKLKNTCSHHRNQDFRLLPGCSELLDFSIFAYPEQLKLGAKQVKDSLYKIAGIRDVEVVETLGMENQSSTVTRRKFQFVVMVSWNWLFP